MVTYRANPFLPNSNSSPATSAPISASLGGTRTVGTMQYSSQNDIHDRINGKILQHLIHQAVDPSHAPTS